jgi:predicted acyltransferase (DUF342 family)
MKINWILAIGLISSQLSWGALTQSQYDAQVKTLYASLERSQADLNRALDNRDQHQNIINKACVYASNMRSLQKLSQDNLNLKKAAEEAEFIKGLITSFDVSFKELGTSFRQSCKS